MALKIGVWGGAYPRVGYVTHPTPVVASALAAVRAFNIARQPVDLWPVQGVVRPTIPLVPSAQGDRAVSVHVPPPDAHPAVLFPGGLRHGEPDDIAAVADRHL